MNTSKTDDIRSFLDWALKGRSAWWIYVIGIVLLVFIFFAGSALVMLPLIGLIGPLDELPAIGVLIVEDLAFIPLLLAPLLLVWLLHKRPWWSVVVPRPRMEWWNFGIGILVSLLVQLGIWTFNGLFWGIKITTVSPNLGEYLPFLLVAFFLVFIQTTGEELMFRGYSMQFFRRFTAIPILIIILTGVWFAAPHIPNLSSLGWPWYGVFVYIFDGSILAWLAYRTGSLWMSMGWHWANNFILITVLSVKTDVATGFSILSADSYPAIGLVILNKVILYTLVILIINRLVSRRERVGER